MKSQGHDRGREIAIIGFHGRFPKAGSRERFWDNLTRGRNCIEEIPPRRWDYLAHNRIENGAIRVIGKWGAFLEDIDKFDAGLFGLPDREAAEMDPQQRLFIQTAWTALEDAGYGDQRQHPIGQCGLFVGAMWHDYSLCTHEYGYLQDRYCRPGSLLWELANRTSFVLNLTGPSIAVDTACASSLLAVHMACQSLLAGECKMAVAGGVNLHLHPSKFIYLSQASLLSAEAGKACLAPGSEGYLPGEGVGALVLKPLDAAQTDRDHIYGVIKGSATNHSGRGMFFRVPDSQAQALVIRDALAKAGVTPETISYIEMSAHGSELADSAEFLGLCKAFRSFTEAKQFCALGSLKPNIGHLEAASGICQIIRVLLQFQHKQLTPSLFSACPMPELEIDDSPFFLQRSLADWPLLSKTGDNTADRPPRRAGVSSFGAGGTNVHLILEDYDVAADGQVLPQVMSTAAQQNLLFLYSARTLDTLKTGLAIHKRFLETQKCGRGMDLIDIAYTLQVGREAMPVRVALLAGTIEELIQKLEAFLADDVYPQGLFGPAARAVEDLPAMDESLAGATPEQLAMHWTAGATLDWNQLYPGAKPRRIPLPTYPFEQNTYWISPAGKYASRQSGQPDSGPGSSKAAKGESKSEFLSYLMHLLADETDLGPDGCKPFLPFADMGLDSIVIKKLNARMEKDIGRLPKTLFFEHKTPDSLADYFAGRDDLRLPAGNGCDFRLSPETTEAGNKCQALYVRPSCVGLSSPETDIAVIGLSGRYPKSPDLNAFWQNLITGRDCITKIPADRWDHDQWIRQHGIESPMAYHPWGGFIDDVDRFDALFFKIAPREAELMDPQERLFLQSAWEVIEDAGYTVEGLNASAADLSTGVFVGVMWAEYQLYGLQETLQGNPVSPNACYWSIPNRVSYCFDFTGPSIAVDTACSSSLTAIHMACESLRHGICGTAIAGGINLNLHPVKYLYLCQRKFASHDGKCRSFGEGGSGYVPGEGVGAVLLKPLSRAIADNDHIYGIIKASDINHGGNTNGYMVPSPIGQARVISGAMKRARIDPASITYIEAHGTGTALGDPIEIEGLRRVFGETQSPGQACAVGSVKGNIGHTEASAGVAGLTKILLQMQHGQIAPSLHSQTVNPNIDFENLPFFIPQTAVPWQRVCGSNGTPGKAVPRTAGISSFGAGGANAHLIIQEYQAASQAVESPEAQVIVLSAATEDRLHAYAQRLLDFVARIAGVASCEPDEISAFAPGSHVPGNDFQCLENIAYTLQVGRQPMKARMAFVAHSMMEMVRLLEQYRDADTTTREVYRGNSISAAKQPYTDAAARSDQKDVAAAIKSGDLQRLAQLWVRGESVDWPLLHTARQPRRVSLPTYPFASSRYWIPTGQKQVKPETASVQANCFMSASITDYIEDKILKSLADQLKIAQAELDCDTPYKDYGIDSVMAVAVIDQINNALNIDLQGTDLFNHATIRMLANYITRRFDLSILRQKEQGLPQAVQTTQDASEAPDVRTYPVDRQKAPVMTGVDRTESADIAVIGIAGRFPDADNVHAFWDNLVNHHCAVRCVDRQGELWQNFFDADQAAPDKSYSKWAGLLSAIDRFDPHFFNISPKEAELMDPQQRLFLEQAYLAFEDAGYSQKMLEGSKCGVFVGCFEGDYRHLVREYGQNGDVYAVTGNMSSILASRIAFFLNLKGPAVAIDTACSSSLVAVHHACESLRNQTCDMAIAGGVLIMATPELFHLNSAAESLSPTGSCRAFDDAADGLVLGEAVAAIILKPLSAALRDQDRIYGVIKGSGINQDGHTNGLTAPSATAQRDLISDVYRRYNIDPASIGYVEAHGTGTKLGDPIEIQALTEAFGGQALKTGSCAIGSVKTNIGHAFAAAGIVGLVKVLLALSHEQIPASLNYDKENRHIDFQSGPFYVNTRLQPWRLDSGQIRRAAVSAFGFSGTNGHLVVEQPPKPERKPSTARPYYLILVSGRTDAARRQRLKDLHGWLTRPQDPPLIAEIAYTLCARRSHFAYRSALVVTDTLDLKTRCGQILSNSVVEVYLENTTPAVRFKAEPALLELGLRVCAELKNKPLVAADSCREKLFVLADLYVKGYDVPIFSLYQDEAVRPICLPPYPFARERYWVGAEKTQPNDVQAITGPGIDTGGDDSEILYYQSVWQVADPGMADSCPKEKRPILLFDDEPDLEEAFKRRGVTVVRVQVGDAFKQEGRHQYRVNPASLNDLKQLLVSLDRNGSLPGRIVHHWLTGTSTGDGLQSCLGLSIHFLMTLTQAIIRNHPKDPVRILSINHRHAWNDSSASVALAAQDALSAFGGVLQKENPNIMLRVIAVADTNQTLSADILLNEFGTETTGRMVAYRDGKRHIRSLRPLTPPPDDETGPGLLKKHGVYLITGGAGGLGRIFARYLAATWHARLALCGRSRADAAIEKVLADVQIAGGEAVYFQADLSRYEDVEKMIEHVRDRYGALNGIIHAAGLRRDGFILTKERRDIDAVLAPKIWGTLHLDRALKNEPLDFYVMFSSGAALIGNAGQSDYAFANAFMDNFAAFREKLRADGERRGRTLAINWPFWRDGGMRLSGAEQADFFTQTGMAQLPAEQGTACFNAALMFGAPQCAVFYGQKEKIAAYLERYEAESAGSVEPAKRAFDDRDHNRLKTAVARYLKGAIGKLTGLEPAKMDAHGRFDQYGLHSIAISRFNAHMESILGSLSKTLLFEYQSIAELTDYFITNHADGWRRHFQPDQSNGSAGCKSRLRGIAPIASPSAPLKESPDDSAVAPVAAGPGDIAIIGISGRYPMAPTIPQFWENLKNGKDCITSIPDTRWDSRQYFDADPDRAADGKMYCKWGGFLDDADAFDPLFFGISPREAHTMDPQERLFLETVWAAFEDAGLLPLASVQSKQPQLTRSVGVFAGVTTHAANSLIWSLANRVSYVLNFHGPSMPVDTACSSSLTAVHLACESLKRKECDLAVAGGVNLYFDPARYAAMCRNRMLSFTGRCHAFGKAADGFVPGEGVGAVLLKPLAAAIRDNNLIHAVIKSSAVNHAGATNGYTVPSPEAQARLVAQALRNAGVDPCSISYIEAHGTGTRLGDPIEITGLDKVFRPVMEAEPFCSLGSVKSNIGHLESAAGIAGLTKIVLQMKYRQLAPSLHSNELNPNIDFSRSPFVVQHKLGIWSQSAAKNGEIYPRRAGISAFGAGGANAHVIIEEYAPSYGQTTCKGADSYIFVLSARNPSRLRQAARNFVGFLQTPPGRLPDGKHPCAAAVAFTLQTGRLALPYRLALVASDLETLAQQLSDYCSGEPSRRGVYQGHVEEANPVADQLVDGTSGQAYLESLINIRELHKLAQLWSMGIEIDWQRLYPEPAPHPVSLPTYPFARESYRTAKDTHPRPEQKDVKDNPQLSRQTGTPSENQISLKPPERVKLTSTGPADKPHAIALNLLPSNLIEAANGYAPEKKREITRKDMPLQFGALQCLPEPCSTVPSTVGQMEEFETDAKVGQLSDETIRRSLIASLAQALFMPADEVKLAKKFVDLGLDSIIGVEWIKAVNAEFDLSLQATKIYDYPTVKELARFIKAELMRRPVPMTPDFECEYETMSLDDLLRGVYEGTIEITQANRLHRRYFTKAG